MKFHYIRGEMKNKTKKQESSNSETTIRKYIDGLITAELERSQRKKKVLLDTLKAKTRGKRVEVSNSLA